MPFNTTLLSRGIKRGLLTLRREREYGTTLGVLAGILFLAQVLLLTGVGMQAVRGLLQQQLDLRLQVHDTADEQAVQEFIAALKSQTFVESVQYITREQAYERERARNPQLTQFLEEFHIQNPFPDTLAVRLETLGDYDSFAAFARNPAWTSVVDPAFLSQTTNQEKEVRQMLQLTETARALVLLFLAVITGVLLFVLMELVRRRALQRREEILVERLCGAPEASILVPFATEAALLLAVATLISGAVFLLILFLLPLAVPALGSAGALATLRAETVGLYLSTLIPIGILTVLLIPALSFVGAFLGMRPQMRGGRIALA